MPIEIVWLDGCLYVYNLVTKHCAALCADPRYGFRLDAMLPDDAAAIQNLGALIWPR